RHTRSLRDWSSDVCSSDLTNLINVPSTPDTGESNEYVYVDKTPVASAIAYYRIRQTFKNGKFVTHSLSAIRFRADKSFAIERLNPSPFQEACDVSYYLPKSGRVWLQITDSKGKIMNTENFIAPEGKNIYLF